MKKNLLKLLTLVLALVMVVTVFAGCKKADEETVAPTQGSEETPTETQEQPADEYKPSAAQLLNGKEWGKDYTELYDEIGDKVTIDDVQEDQPPVWLTSSTRARPMSSAWTSCPWQWSTRPLFPRTPSTRPRTTSTPPGGSTT